MVITPPQTVTTIQHQLTAIIFLQPLTHPQITDPAANE